MSSDLRPKGADASGRPIIRSKEEQDRRQAQRLAWLASSRPASRSPRRGESDEKDRDKDKERKSHKSHRRHRKRRSRSRSRSRSRDSRSRSRERRRSRSPRRERERHRRSRSRSDDRYGYSPRRRKGEYAPGSAVPVLPGPGHAGLPVSSATAAAFLQRKAVELTAEAQRKAAEFAAQQRVSALASRAATAYKKSREIHVSGLALGNIPSTQEVLRAFFDAAMAGLPCPSLGACSPDPPVLAVTSFENGKYSFVELRAEEQATAALTLTGTSVAGRVLAVARPAGFADPGLMKQLVEQAAGAAAEACQQLNMPPWRLPNPQAGSSACVRLDHMATTQDLDDPQALAELKEDITEEAAKFGTVMRLAITAAMPPGIDGEEAPATLRQPAVYILFGDAGVAARAQAAFHGRLYDGRSLVATLVWPREMEAAGGGGGSDAVPADAAVDPPHEADGNDGQVDSGHPVQEGAMDTAPL